MEHRGLSLAIGADREIEIFDDVGCVACVLQGQIQVTTDGIRLGRITRGQNVSLKRGSSSLLRAFCDALVFIPTPRGAFGTGFARRRDRKRSLLTIAASQAESLAKLAR